MFQFVFSIPFFVTLRIYLRERSEMALELSAEGATRRQRSAARGTEPYVHNKHSMDTQKNKKIPLFFSNSPDVCFRPPYS